MDYPLELLKEVQPCESILDFGPPELSSQNTFMLV